MRGVVAGEVSALIRHGKQSLEQAVARVFSDTLAPLGGEGGLISLCPNGDFVMQFNTAGMFRGVITADGGTSVAIF